MKIEALLQFVLLKSEQVKSVGLKSIASVPLASTVNPEYFVSNLFSYISYPDLRVLN